MKKEDDVKYLKGVGPKRAETLHKLDIYTLEDLLKFFPRAYEDMSNVVSIRNAPKGEAVCIKGFTGVVHQSFIRKGMTLYKVEVSDGESLMEVTFFNNSYIPKLIKEGYDYLFFGKVDEYRGFYSMSSPKFVEYSTESEKFSPVYRQTEGLNSRAISRLVRNALDEAENIEEFIPERIVSQHKLFSHRQALESVHFPKNENELKEAKRRLSFEELFLLQIGLQRLKLKSRKASSHILEKDYTAEFKRLLPFELTGAQSKVIAECVADMSCSTPMNRLVQGDVGSGKTVVAAAAAYNCIKNGYQVALMAPTEVLAGQHLKSFRNFYKDTGIAVEVITGSMTQSEKKKIKQRLFDGGIDLLIGTHALIQQDVEFKNLGLAITDEQHRFGVNQRDALVSKGVNPHILVMSATPIPRTLSLIIYGDLDLSIIDELPKGRKPVETYLVDASIHDRVYGYVKKHLLEGRQGYIVCPLVDEDEITDEQIAAKELYKKLSNGYFNGFKLGLLYGKMKANEKKQVMESFARGETDLLISTTVIEVGVDVPNAVIMVIENSERFGLSQLHQLRGRIGRGKYQSSCIMVTGSKDEATLERLKIIASTADGFKIADEDLKMRGPGDFFGERQHGLPSILTAGFMTDGEIIRETNQCAVALLNENPALEGEEYSLLRSNVNKMFSKGTMLN